MSAQDSNIATDLSSKAEQGTAELRQKAGQEQRKHDTELLRPKCDICKNCLLDSEVFYW